MNYYRPPDPLTALEKRENVIRWWVENDQLIIRIAVRKEDVLGAATALEEATGWSEKLTVIAGFVP